MKYYLIYLFNGKVVQIDSYEDQDDFYRAMLGNSQGIIRDFGQGRCSDNKLFNEVQELSEVI